MKWVIAIPSVGAGNRAIRALLREGGHPESGARSLNRRAKIIT